MALRERGLQEQLQQGSSTAVGTTTESGFLSDDLSLSDSELDDADAEVIKREELWKKEEQEFFGGEMMEKLKENKYRVQKVTDEGQIVEVVIIETQKTIKSRMTSDRSDSKSSDNTSTASSSKKTPSKRSRLNKKNSGEVVGGPKKSPSSSTNTSSKEDQQKFQIPGRVNITPQKEKVKDQQQKFQKTYKSQEQNKNNQNRNNLKLLKEEKKMKQQEEGEESLSTATTSTTQTQQSLHLFRYLFCMSFLVVLYEEYPSWNTKEIQRFYIS